MNANETGGCKKGLSTFLSLLKIFLGTAVRATYFISSNPTLLPLPVRAKAQRSLLPIIIRSKNPFLPDKNEISREGTYSALALKEEKRRI